MEALLELAPLELGHLHLHAPEGAIQALAEKRQRVIEAALVDGVAPDRPREAGIEAVQGRVRNRTAQHRVNTPVDLAR